MKLRNAVETICDLDFRFDETDRQKLYDRARFLVREGVINPDEPVRRGQTAAYRLDTVCALRLCLALYDFGLEVGTVAEIARSFHHPMVPGRDDRPHEIMVAAVEAVRRNDDVRFEVEVGRVRGRPEPFRLGRFVVNGESLGDETPRSPILDTATVFAGFLRLDVSALISGLVTEAE